MTSLFSLEGRIAIVTGALGRLGRVWIRGLLEAGGRVAAIDRLDGTQDGWLGALRATHEGDLFYYRVDVTERASLLQSRQAIRGDLGRPEILINNAGIDQPPSAGAKRDLLEEIPLEVSRKILEVNTLGAFLVAQVFGPDMVEQGHGSIINIGSLYASVAPDPRFYDHIPGDPPFLKPPAYGFSKAALINLTKYLATAWGPHGVRVNALSPGGVLGDQDEDFKRKFCERVPLGRMAEEKDILGPLLFLASDASRYVTGTELRVDGGFTAW